MAEQQVGGGEKWEDSLDGGIIRRLPIGRAGFDVAHAAHLNSLEAQLRDAQNKSISHNLTDVAILIKLNIVEQELRDARAEAAGKSWYVGLTESEDEILIHFTGKDGREIEFFLSDEHVPTELAETFNHEVTEVQLLGAKALYAILTALEKGAGGT